MSSAVPYLLVIDARRADTTLLKSTIAVAPPESEIWVIAVEPLLPSKRVSRWLPDDTEGFLPLDLKTQNANVPIVFAKAGETTFPKSNSVHSLRFRGLDAGDVDVWRGWAYVPRGHFANWPTLKVRKFIRGHVERDRDPDSRTIPNEALELPRVLLVGHTDIVGPVGGVQLHVRDMIEWLDKDHLVFFMTPDKKGLLIRAFYKGKPYESIKEFEWKAFDALSNPAAEKAFRELLKSIEPDYVHFHHLLGLPYSLVRVAKERVRTVVSLHDFYAFCPRYDLIDENGNFCNFCGKETSCKSKDDAYKVQPFRGSAKDRRETIREILRGVTKIVPSSNTKRLLVENLKLVADEIVVREYPIAEQNLEMKSSGAAKRRKPGEINVGFIGAFTQKKGAELFARLVRTHAESHPWVKWKVFGEIGESDIAIDLMDDYDVEFFGSYARGQLKTLLRRENVDLGLILSIWPETYAMTVAEATAAGCIPVVTDVGAPPERVSSLGHGWVLGFDTLEKDFAVVLEQIKLYPELLERRKLGPTPGQFESRMTALIETVKGPRAGDRRPATPPRSRRAGDGMTSSPRA